MSCSTQFDAIVCIPTFRRAEHLRKTLASLIAQTGNIRFAVVVVDNDIERREGKAVAEEIFATGTLNGICVVEEEQGNCHAINRAFSTARSMFDQVEFFLMIDDDEVASESWLAEMIASARNSGADLVGGPVRRIFETTPSRGLNAHTIFNNGYVRSGFVPTLHGSGNVLIRRRVFDSLGEPSFDIQFNFLGGADMDFFTRSRRAGFVSYWNSSAEAFETVPSKRMSISWVLKRSIFIGVINYKIDRKYHPGVRGLSWLIIKNSLTLPLSVARALVRSFETQHWLPATFPVCVSIGRNLAIFGFEPAPYKFHGASKAIEKLPL